MQPINEIVQEIPQEIALEASKPAAIEFDLLDLLLVLAARKRLILLTAFVFMVVVGLFVYLRAPTFTAKAQILPPQQEQSGAAALMEQFGAVASMAGMGEGGGGGGGGLGLKNPNDLFVGILKSETVADAVIKQFDLMHLYHAKTLGTARARLASSSKFVSEKDNLISIAVKDHDPRRAALIANGYVTQLHALNTHLAFTQASQKRLFYEQQLEEEKNKLADAEVALKQTEEQTGVILPTGQLETIIRQIAQVQAEITAHEVELDALRISSTEQNPDVVRLNSELASLHQQERDLEAGQKGKHVQGDIAISSSGAPQLGLEYVRKERDVKYHQLLFDLIARQYEAARIDEAKQAPVIQVIDPALVPERRSGHRSLWVLIAGFVGFFFGCVWVFTAYIYHRLENDERTGARMALLKRELELGR